MAIRLSTNRLDLDSANLQSAEMRAWSETVNTLGSVSGATTINLALGNVVTATVTGAVTWSVTNASSSNVSSFTLILTNGGSAAQTWMGGTAWAGGVAPTLSSSGTDVLTFFTTDAGTTWRGVRAGQGAEAVGQKLFVWGYNTGGQLGLGDTAHRSSPVQLAGQWTSFNAQSNGGYSFGIKRDGSLWAWGRNGHGNLGLGDSGISRSSPVQIPGTWVMVRTSGNAQNSIALKADGSLWVWGRNYQGSLGLGDTIGRSSPVQLDGTWSFISGGDHRMHAIRQDGSLWSWGNQNYGELGLGDSGIKRSSPAQVAGTWTFVNTAERTTALMRATGTIWFTGRNADFGNFGVEDKINRSSPVQVPGTWRNMGVDWGGSSAVRHDGTLWVWGYNGPDARYTGILGTGDTITRSSPVQIGSGTWKSAIRGESRSMALTAAGGLFAWGKGDNGNHGLGDTIKRTSPVQVAGTWTSMTAGRHFSGGFKI